MTLPLKVQHVLCEIICAIYVWITLDIGGRIYRHGKTSNASCVQLGTVEAIASKQLPPQLRMGRLDQIVLFPNNDGDYECDLFWDGVVPPPVQPRNNVCVFVFILTIKIDIGEGRHWQCSRLAHQGLRCQAGC